MRTQMQWDVHVLTGVVTTWMYLNCSSTVLWSMLRRAYVSVEAPCDSAPLLPHCGVAHNTYCTCVTLLACVSRLTRCQLAGGVHHLLDCAVLAAGTIQRGKMALGCAADEA